MRTKILLLMVIAVCSISCNDQPAIIGSWMLKGGDLICKNPNSDLANYELHGAIQTQFNKEITMNRHIEKIVFKSDSTYLHRFPDRVPENGVWKMSGDTLILIDARDVIRKFIVNLHSNNKLTLSRNMRWFQTAGHWHTEELKFVKIGD